MNLFRQSLSLVMLYYDHTDRHEDGYTCILSGMADKQDKVRVCSRNDLKAVFG